MTLNERYQDTLRNGCKEARAWAKKRSLVQAWRDCRNGQWIAWWVYESHLHLSGGQGRKEVFLRLQRCAKEAGVTSGLFVFCEPNDPRTLARYADNVRAAFYPSGRFRP